jgi:hypothetical protein
MDMVREAEKELGRGVEEKLELNRFDRAFHSLLCRHRHMHNQTDLLTDEWMNRWMDGWRDGWRDGGMEGWRDGAVVPAESGGGNC